MLDSSVPAALDCAPQISVCMATYNGAAYVEDQVSSILAQLQAADELIIVDDCSKDDTVARLQRFTDSRVRVSRNESNRGHVSSFEKALGMARHPIIMLADQDDRWLSGRVSALIDALRASGALVASSNTDFMNAAGERIDYRMDRLQAGDSRRHLRNVLRIFRGTAAYFGCAMAFRRELLDLVLPVPRFVEAHDLWIALASNLVGSNVHVERDTLTRRIHGQNLSLTGRSLYRKLRTRWLHLRALAVLAGRYATLRKSLGR